MPDISPRERNRKAQACDDCGVIVEPGHGFLYRYSGANCTGLVRVTRKPSKYSPWIYVVRCEEHATDKRAQITRAAEQH